MNFPPDSREAISERILSKHRSRMRDRLIELEREGRALRYQSRELNDRIALYCGKVASALDDLRQAEETTVKLKALPPTS